MASRSSKALSCAIALCGDVAFKDTFPRRGGDSYESGYSREAGLEMARALGKKEKMEIWQPLPDSPMSETEFNWDLIQK